MLTLYGIRNCDTVKKARSWLAAEGLSYRFHDYKVDGVDPGRLAQWVDRLGWETVLNCAGTTFRKLPEGERAGLNPARAIALMLAYPSAIKRPIVEVGDTLLLGFKPDAWRDAGPGG